MKLSACAAIGAALVLGAAGCNSGTTSGSGAPAPSVAPAQTQIQTQPAPAPAPVQMLSCTIDASSYPWNPAGRMDVKVDGVSVGQFAFDRRGSSALNFNCAAGVHSYRMEAAGTSIYCTGNFSVDAQHTDFLPAMELLKNRQTVCRLAVNGKS